MNIYINYFGGKNILTQLQHSTTRIKNIKIEQLENWDFHNIHSSNNAINIIKTIDYNDRFLELTELEKIIDKKLSKRIIEIDNGIRIIAPIIFLGFISNIFKHYNGK